MIKKEFSIEKKNIVSDVIELLNESRECYNFFNAFIEELDQFASLGLKASNGIDDIENDIMCLLEHTLPGICSRVFWGQFNPQCDNDEFYDSGEYLTLPERIKRYLTMLDKIGDNVSKTGIVTPEGQEIYNRLSGNTRKLVQWSNGSV